MDGQQLMLSAEYLRVMSPSAEVQGHSPAEAQLQVGKRDVVSLVLNPSVCMLFVLSFPMGMTLDITTGIILDFFQKKKIYVGTLICMS